MPWLYLILAITLEVSGTTCMKLSDGFTRPVASMLMLVFYVLSLVSLTFAVKQIDISISYAVWSGLGTGLIALIGIAWFGEPLTAIKVMALALIVIGVVAINLST